MAVRLVVKQMILLLAFYIRRTWIYTNGFDKATVEYFSSLQLVYTSRSKNPRDF